MCEHFVARADEPFRVDGLWEFAERLEHYGIAGFSWGAAWLDGHAGDGAAPIQRYRAAIPFHEDAAGREKVGAVETTSLLVHLRRPSRFTTLGLADTQPFTDRAGRFAFSHNGELREWRPARRRYQAEGRIEGRADSEVAARWMEDAFDPGVSAEDLFAGLHGAFGGLANLALMTADGRCWGYAGNDENPVFAFRLGRIRIVSTGVYSLDRSLFRLAARGAEDRRLVPLGRTAAI